MTAHHIPEWLLVSLIVLCAAVSRLIYTSMYDDLYDDAYITFRFAQNIAEGKGFVYNAPERVYGASSPLYTGVAAGICALGGRAALPIAARWLGVLALLICALLLYKYVPLVPVARLMTLAFLLGYPRLFYSSVGGMEECIILLLMALSIVGLVRGSPLLLGIAVGLLIVTKVDTAVWIVCLLVVALLRRQPSLWLSAAIAGGLAAPWFIFSLMEFGSLVPHTILAKQVAFQHWSALFLSDAISITVPAGFQGHTLMVVLFATFWYSMVFLALWHAMRRREWLFLQFPLYCIMYACVLLFSGTSLGLWPRWTVPLWGSLVVCLGYTIHVMMLHLKRWTAAPISYPMGGVILLSCALLLVLSFAYPSRSAMAMDSHKSIAGWLHEHALPGESIMMEPIGLVGYESGLYVHDFIGLVSPQVTEARQRAGRTDRWFAKYLLEHTPTYVLLRVEEVRMNQFKYGGNGDGVFTSYERLWFDAHYHSAMETPPGPYVDAFVLFRRWDPTNGG